MESEMMWIMLNPRMTPDRLGFLPSFLSEDDPRPAKVQIQENYISGWNKFDGFELRDGNVLKFPGDPPMKPIAMTQLRDEEILFYEHDWLVIKQHDGTWEAARID